MYGKCVYFPIITHFNWLLLFFLFLFSSHTSTEDLHKRLQLSLRLDLRTSRTHFSSTQTFCRPSLSSTSDRPASWRLASTFPCSWNLQSTLTASVFVKRVRKTLNLNRTSTTTPRPTQTATIASAIIATSTAARLAHLLLIPHLAIIIRKWIEARKVLQLLPNLGNLISPPVLLVNRNLKSPQVVDESQLEMTRFVFLS